MTVGSDTGCPARHRIAGIDLARALAVVGMLAVHLGPDDDAGIAGALYDIPHGRASILFVLLAGVGVALLSARPERHVAARVRLVWLAVVLFPLGLALQTLDHGVAVILQYYSVFYLLGLSVLALNPRLLLVLAIGTTVSGPLLYLAGQDLAPELFAHDIAALGSDPGVIARGLLVSGYYPLLTWAPALLWGVWLGRQDLRSRFARLRLIGWGAAIALGTYAGSHAAFGILGAPGEMADWRNLFAVTAHSQMLFWLVSALGSAVLTLGLSLVMAERFPRHLRPFVTLGQMALSFYVAHLLVLAVAGEALRHERVAAAAVTVAAFIAAATALAAFWRARLGRGPVERLIVLPFMNHRERFRPWHWYRA